MKSTLNKFMPWAVVASEFSHVFCCVLPTVVSAITLLSGMGYLVALPAIISDLHDAIHAYELWIIGTTGVITALAWWLHFASKGVDCHNTGCAHAPCGPTKKRAHRVLVFGTILFAVNVTIYTFVHYLPEHGAYDLRDVVGQSHDDHNHDHHDHDDH